MISQYDFVTSVYLDHATIFVLVVYSCTWLMVIEWQCIQWSCNR